MTSNIKSVDELNISVRTYNCLNYNGIKSIDELICYTPKDLMKIHNFGKKCLNDLNEELNIHGIHLNNSSIS